MRGAKKLRAFVIFVVLMMGWLIYSTCRERSFLMQLSMSSDGHYVISTHHGRYLVLWDIVNQTKKVMHRDINIHSVYFIPDSHNFLWQNVNTNEVDVESAEGKIVKRFNPGFPVYGHVMKSDLRTYIASDVNWNLYYLNDDQIKQFQWDKTGYIGGMKLLGMSLSANLFLTSGTGNFSGEKYPISIARNDRELRPFLPERLNFSLLDGVTLWNIKTHRPLKKFIGNNVKTDAVLSLDEKFAVAGCENAHLYSWDIATGKRVEMFNPAYLQFNCYYNEKCIETLKRNIKENIPQPYDFILEGGGARTIAVRFIDEKNHFIQFINNNSVYGLLYKAGSPKLLAYLKLGSNPKPQTFYYANASMIDTAPKAKLLVMGHNYMGRFANKIPINKGSGIIVYKFDERTQQLKRIWAPDGPSWHWNFRNLLMFSPF